MRYSWGPRALVITWLACGCGKSPSDDDTSTSSQGSGEASTASDSGTPMTSEATVTLPPTTGDGPATTGDTTATSTGADGSSDGASASTGPADTGPACQPPAPEGNTCLECVVNNCCMIWVNCQADEACACVVDCHVIQGNSLGMCSNQCNLDSDLYQGLYLCGEAHCLGSCDWTCC